MFQTILRPLMAINTVVLRAGRTLAWIALALMVFVILLQVFFRYVLNAALPWPDEAARFLMLWMTGLIAPSAYRWGGFVAIDMLPRALRPRPAAFLNLILLLVSTCVLVIAVQLGWNHTMGFGGTFESSSLTIPLNWLGGEAFRLKLRYMYASLFVCFVMLLVINFELILRTIAQLCDPDVPLPDDDQARFVVGAD